MICTHTCRKRKPANTSTTLPHNLFDRHCIHPSIPLQAYPRDAYIAKTAEHARAQSSLDTTNNSVGRILANGILGVKHVKLLRRLAAGVQEDRLGTTRVVLKEAIVSA